MCQVLKFLSQFFHGEFGFSLFLQFGQLSEHIAAAESTQDCLTCLERKASKKVN